MSDGGRDPLGDMLDTFGRGPDGRSTSIPSGGGVPPWMAEMLNYCARCGTELAFGSIEGEDRDRLGCPSCGYIAYVNPRLVVTTIPVTDAGEIVLLRRGIEPGKGWWAQPGGFLEVDETVGEAAVRETLEETGPDRRAGRDRRALLAARGGGRRPRVRGARRRRRAAPEPGGAGDPRRSPPTTSRGRGSRSRRATGRSATGSIAAARTSTRPTATGTSRRRVRRLVRCPGRSCIGRMNRRLSRVRRVGIDGTPPAMKRKSGGTPRHPLTHWSYS